MAIEISIVCEECGADLDSDFGSARSGRYEDAHYTVPLCESCLKQAKDEAFDKGNDQGYQEGLKDGILQGKQEVEEMLAMEIAVIEQSPPPTD